MGSQAESRHNTAPCDTWKRVEAADPACLGNPVLQTQKSLDDGTFTQIEKESLPVFLLHPGKGGKSRPFSYLGGSKENFYLFLLSPFILFSLISLKVCLEGSKRRQGLLHCILCTQNRKKPSHCYSAAYFLSAMIGAGLENPQLYHDDFPPRLLATLLLFRSPVGYPSSV